MPLTKQIFRQICLKKIKNSTTHNKLYKNHLLNTKLLKELKFTKKKNILFYYPLPFEANVIQTLKHMRKKCTVFVPFMEAQSFKMVPFRLPLKRNSFGIFEAGNTIRNIKKIDIAIVPAVGVDGNLQRVGFGKGMYDRFFAKLKKRPYIIFIQPEICYTKKFICDTHDIACDLLLTPKARMLPMARVKKRKK
ncbi:MAG: 5-formyltetrahydrofolate cyclo-ligase [Campylobacterales bacterium]|nr:5-formyltetrahydrofolate cyclo-ligase [Campylobacterales bacterium]